MAQGLLLQDTDVLHPADLRGEGRAERLLGGDAEPPLLLLADHQRVVGVGGVPVGDVRAAGGEERDGGAGVRAADALEDPGDGALAVGGADPVRPVVAGVVDGEIGAEAGDGGRFGGAAGRADDGGAAVPGVLDEERADAAGRREDEDGVLGAEGGEAEDAHGHPAGAHHRDGPVEGDGVGEVVQPVGGGDGAFGVAAGDHAEVGDDAAAEPGGVGVRAERVHGAGDLAAGDGGEGGFRPVGERGGAQGGVDEVDAGGGDGDPDLAGAGLGVGDLLVAEVLGRAVGVELDGVHGGGVVLPGGPVGRSAGGPVSWCPAVERLHGATSSELEVKLTPSGDHRRGGLSARRAALGWSGT